MKSKVLIRNIISIVLLVANATFLALAIFFVDNIAIEICSIVGVIAAAVVVLLLALAPDEIINNGGERVSLNSMVGLYTLSANEPFKLHYFNDTFAHLHGYKNAAELSAANFDTLTKLLTPATLTAVQNLIIEGIACDRSNLEREIEVNQKDGSTRKLFAWGQLRREKGSWAIDGCVADLSNQEKFHQDMELLNDTLTAATSMLSSMVFLVNIPERTLRNLSGSKFMGQFYDYVEDFPTALLNLRSIYQEDKEILIAAIDDLLAGKKECDIVMRIYSTSDKLHYMHLRTKTVFDHDNIPVRAIAILEDVTDNKLREEKLQEKAEIDPLTKIFNRQTVVELISQALTTSGGAFLFLDLDQFKLYNDTYGHQKGDERLTLIANAMAKSIRNNDIIGRLAGDEFVIFLRGVNTEKEVRAVATKVAESVKALNPANEKVSVTVSIGIALSPLHGDDFEMLYSNADKAMYAAKSIGKNAINFFKYTKT